MLAILAAIFGTTERRLFMLGFPDDEEVSNDRDPDLEWKNVSAAVRALPREERLHVTGIVRRALVLWRTYPDLEKKLERDDAASRKEAQHLLDVEGLPIFLNRAFVNWYCRRVLNEKPPSFSPRFVEDRIHFLEPGDRGRGRVTRFSVSNGAAMELEHARKRLRARENEIGEFEARAEAIEGKARHPRDGERMIGREKAALASAARASNSTPGSFRQRLRRQARRVTEKRP